MRNDRRLLLTLLTWALMVRPGVAQVERFSLIPAHRAAQTHAPASTERPHPAVVRVIVPERDATSYGSGTLIDVNDAVGLIVTNWHVVQSATTGVTVQFPDGFRSTAQVVKTDKEWDLAALVIARPNVAAVTISPTAPRPGEILTIAGYGQGNYRSASGRCIQYLAPSPSAPNEIVELAADARQGDSGGPIFNARGELAGVLFGEAKGLTSGSYCGRVDRFLKAAFANSARAPNQPTYESAPQRMLPPVEPSNQTQGAIEKPISPSGGSFRIADPVLTRTPRLAMAPLGSSPLSHNTSTLDWQSLLGDTPMEVIKSFLAFVGVMALVALVMRHSTSKGKVEAMPSD